MNNDKKTSYVPLMIVFAFLAFGLFIGSMVYQMFQLDINLVRDDYYQKSTQHDEKMNEEIRTEKVNIDLFYDRKNENITFIVPNEWQDVSGEIQFYRPSDSKMDFTVPIVMQNSKQILSTGAIANGKWQVKAFFEHQGETFYKEITFIK